MRNIILSALMVLLMAFNAQAGDLAGIWNAEVTESLTNCKTLGWDYVGNYTIEIFQSKNNLIIQGERPNVKYMGRLNDENPNIGHLSATYMDDGGYVTELVDVEFIEGDTGKGGVVWRWSDGVYSCGGSFSFLLTRK